MVRAAIQAVRTARRFPVRRFSSRRPSVISFSGRQPTSSSVPTLAQSSMQLRNLSLTAASALVASGAWYLYHTNSAQPLPVGGLDVTSASPSQSRLFTTAHAESPVDTTRRALLVENDQFYTTVLSEEQPLYKKIDDSDRRVLGMLTPEQATRKLRKNEESYLVNRGKGVVRYDIVQVPSNSPIEDDHAEKIVEVPSAVSAAREGAPNSDWMFWAVFDGHS